MFASIRLYFATKNQYFIGMYESIRSVDDGLEMNEAVGSWSFDKYALLQMYIDMFSRSMTGKWPALCFLDLYAGAGLSRIKDTGEILKGSPLLALEAPVPFSQYIFCEKEPKKLQALRNRSSRYKGVTLIGGDCNERIGDILQAMPKAGLSLCLIDPYDLSINMSTLRLIAEHGKTDFLCLIATGTDANRNLSNYEDPRSKKIERFLGDPVWRVLWDQAKSSNESFVDFLARRFGAGMEALGYLPTPKLNMMRMKTDSNVTLYYLALFSKNELAFKFWAQVLKYSSPQRTLF